MNGKRRAGHANSPELSTPDPPQKRMRKRNDDTHFPDVETVETTQELGEKIISLLKRSQDKNGRLIATEFMALPDKNLYPDYYEQVALPLSINMIDSRLKRGEYSDMTALESDLKRMVQNAKDYNSSKSEVFEDAERIRKALSNFMPKHNPAYLDSEYRAVPTPIPDQVTKIKLRDSSVSGSEPGTIRLKLNTRPRSAAPSEPNENAAADEDMADLQLEILDQLSVQDDAVNFEKKPPRRDYPDYYKVIQRPTSINDVRIMLQQGKIKSWEDFAKECRLIWSNAKEYNEPGSDIYAMTVVLEKWLEDKLQAHGVRPKIVQRLSLKTAQQPPQIKLKMGTPSASSTANNTAYTVDEAALARQNRDMASALKRARDGSEAASTPAPPSHSAARRSVSMVDSDVQMTGMNGHASTPQEVAKPIIPAAPANLPTPTLEGEPPRQEVKPAQATPSAAPLTNGFHAAIPHHSQAAPPGLFVESTNPIDRKLRDPEKSAADAIIQSVTYMTNPRLASDPKWRLVRYASPTKTQTSYYTYLPSTHSSLRIIPDLHADLKTGLRKYKMFVLNNGAIIPASPDVAGQGVYDLHLVPGENVVCVETISALKEGEKKDYAKEWEQFDFERITFYIYLRPREF